MLRNTQPFSDFNRRMGVGQDEGPHSVGRATETMLYQIPGMGKDKVPLLLRAFSTLADLGDALRGCKSAKEVASRIRAKTGLFAERKSSEPTVLEQTLFQLFCTDF
jgi:hypothetical protein